MENNQNTLLEDTRGQLTTKSKNAGLYKTNNSTHGKNRWERKRFSRVDSSTAHFNNIDMDAFVKNDELTVKVPVFGETGNYTVTIRMNGVMKEITNNIKNNSNKLEFKTIIQALTKVFNIGNVYVNCTCADYMYRFNFWNIVNGVSTEDSAHNPGPGKGIANPKDQDGRGCKHVLLVLANNTWLMHVAAVIKNYIFWLAEHKRDLFLKVVFPKLYNVDSDEAKEKGLVPEDFKLDSSKNLIDEINKWGAARGRIPKGSNKNPANKQLDLEAEKNK